MTTRPVAELLESLAEPTRLRIVNCLSAAPLFVSDLSSILDLPERVVTPHVSHLEQLGLIRSYPVVPYLLYAIAPLSSPRDRLLRSVLDALRTDRAAEADRAAALDRSRSRFETRVRGGAVMNAT